MSDLVTEARRLEAQLAKQRRWIAKLFDDRRKTHAEVTRLHEQFAALEEDLHGTAGNPHPSLPVRIHRILAGIQ